MQAEAAPPKESATAYLEFCIAKKASAFELRRLSCLEYIRELLEYLCTILHLNITLRELLYAFGKISEVIKSQIMQLNI